jgi:type IV pilus assembly protein PilA
MISKKLNICPLTFLLKRHKYNKGFTLIEILVVVIILGILSIIALPNLLNQTGKARESEAKSLLSSIAIAQQSYFFEHQSFANSISQLDIAFRSNYFDIDPPYDPASLQSGGFVILHQAYAKNAAATNTRNYALGVYFQNNSYLVILCQSANPQTATRAPDISTGVCANSGDRLE